MNIVLVPYTWIRHVVVALGVGAAAITAWWCSLVFVILLGPIAWEAGVYWSQWLDGVVYLVAVCSAISAASVYVEGALRRRPLTWRIGLAGLTAVCAGLGAISVMWVSEAFVPYLAPEVYREAIASDPNLTTLRYRLGTWGLLGAVSGLAPFAVRQLHRGFAAITKFGVDMHTPNRARLRSEVFADLFFHLAGGVAAATLGAAVWHEFGHQLADDLYLASALGALTWGVVHGLLVWPLPPELYAGWVRVLSRERYGLRIPIDRLNGEPSERFAGHFPRGLDLFLPAERGAAELHVSFVVDQNHRYAVRGLSVQPIYVKRLLETIDLRYDPSRPAPLETELSTGDRIILGEGDDTVTLEFVLLPKEER